MVPVYNPPSGPAPPALAKKKTNCHTTTGKFNKLFAHINISSHTFERTTMGNCMRKMADPAAQGQEILVNNDQLKVVDDLNTTAAAERAAPAVADAEVVDEQKETSASEVEPVEEVEPEATYADWANGDLEEDDEDDSEFIPESEQQFDFTPAIDEVKAALSEVEKTAAVAAEPPAVSTEASPPTITAVVDVKKPSVLKDISLASTNSPRKVSTPVAKKQEPVPEADANTDKNSNTSQGMGKKKKRRNKKSQKKTAASNLVNSAKDILKGSPTTLKRAAMSW
jgi:hypothetical protein